MTDQLLQMQALYERHADYQRNAQEADALRIARNIAIRDALAAGAKPADIARATGLTRARITQIARS